MLQELDVKTILFLAPEKLKPDEEVTLRQAPLLVGSLSTLYSRKRAIPDVRHSRFDLSEV